MDVYTISDREFVLFRDLVHRESGINLTDNKKQLVIGRLGKRLRVLGLKSFKDYYSYLVGEGGLDELTILLDHISTNKTDFFREVGQFDFLRYQLVPQLKNRWKTDRLRIWSAACSTGEEPYSIAITLLEAIPDIDSYDVKILASDISTKVLDVADKGVYEADKLKPLPYDVMQRHFLAGVGDNNGRFRVKGHLRDKVVFRRINLHEGIYPIKTEFDLIFYRNAMIYFDKPTQAEVIRKITGYLKPGGYLFLGHSETLHGIDCHLDYVRPNVYKKMES